MMTNMQVLNPLTLPLSGVNVIEASAGTGKTWTIAALYLRLLLTPRDNGSYYAVSELLVLTFTKAATAELKTRLRNRLLEVQRSLSVSEDALDVDSDPFLVSLRQQLLTLGVSAAEIAQQVGLALANFDEAAIFTIDSFCQKALKMVAFESGLPFKLELVMDMRSRYLRFAYDFWRSEIAHDATLAPLILKSKSTPESWFAQIQPYIGKPYVQFDLPKDDAVANLLAAKQAAWASLVAVSDTTLRELFGMINDAFELETFTKVSFKADKLSTYAEQVLASLALPQMPTNLSADTLKSLEVMSASKLQAWTRKGKTTPEHVFFEHMDDFLRAHEGLDAALEGLLAHKKLALLRWIEHKAAQQIKEQGIQGFSDVLNQLLAALQQPEHGVVLAKRLATTFPVILVDEFQDTDPVQYAIFKQGFIDNGAATFLVGDPKQAIYRFRGGDIYTYLAAKKSASGLFTLTTNFRAESQLMAATNQLVGNQAQPFLTEGIAYQAINAKPADGRALVWVGQSQAAPLQIQRMPPLAEGEKESAERTEAWAVEVTANEIVRLMSAAQNGTAYLTTGVTEGGADAEKIALVGKDVAILVRTKAEGVLMQAELKKRGLSSIVETGASVLASAEAKSLLMLLMAWARPHDMAQLRLALADDLQGWTAANLLALENDEAASLALLTRQQHYADLWQQFGLMAAWRLFYQDSKVAERLLALPNGERALTNYTHLLELLQQASTEVHGTVPLVAWLAREINAPDTDKSQTYELRLESDENLIKISTIHKSKGLQFPIVFCPFLWRAQWDLKKSTFFDYHTAEGQVCAVTKAQLDENPALKQQVTLERFAEELRLLYVAVTRSEFRLSVAWPCTDKLHLSPLAYWLHGQSAAVQSLLNLDAPKKTGKEAFRLSDADIDADLNRWASANPGLIDVRVDELSAEPLLYQAPISADSELALELAINQRHLAASTWFVSSFSSLKNRSIADTLPEEANEWRDLGAESGDYQEFSVDTVAESPEMPESVIFPRGTVAGKCLHRILELLDFTQDIAQSDGLILGQLQLFGFEAHYLDSAKRLLQQTLQAPITPTRKTLAQMTVGQRLDELGFVFPIKNLNLSRFKSVLSHADSGLHPACRKAAEQLQATHLTGYLKGYIDLVLESEGKLYLIDYKSNLLDGYDETNLAEAMAHAHYYLQYLLYSIALKRYVQARGHDFEAVFGGVRYLFVRGLDENGLGIWHDRPSAALLSALEACF